MYFPVNFWAGVECACTLKRNEIPRCEWLMPVILATQEAEIRRISVQSQPGQTV
jgi:hypothetical protein